MEQMFCIAAKVIRIRALWDQADVCRPNSSEIMQKQILQCDAKTQCNFVKVHMSSAEPMSQIFKETVTKCRHGCPQYPRSKKS